MSAQAAFVDGFHASLWLGAATLGLAAIILVIAGPRPGQISLAAEHLQPEPDELVALPAPPAGRIAVATR